MFDTNVENKEYKVSPFSPSNLKLIKDRNGVHFVFQLECITSIEPFWDRKECDVMTSLGQKIRVCMTVDEIYAALIS
ncbi:hypothetical protein L6706_004645 [Salmonella enterica]|nr:hypothetical protein [Salmonella enterica]EKZ3297842.1 hypothetical protein [Salmonella enterica]